MTHFKRPKEDDILECFLYPQFCYSLNPDQITEDMLCMEIDKFKKDVEPFIKDYIWHRDPLDFNIRIKQTLQFNSIIEDSFKTIDFELLPHIYINLRFDEDIGDEWFVVFLIINLTKKYDGLIARMIDSDGEFLLIEAANVIPAWITPETCQNHVFLMNGIVHLVHEKQKVYINTLNSIYHCSHIFKMSDKVQEVINKKISIYPEEIDRRKHKARAYVPKQAFYILCKEPRFIAKAIRTVCHSDSLERKVCRGMHYFPPEQCIMANIKMTKCLYAMASHCRYSGDFRAGWNLPHINSPNYNAYLLGIKIACGLEMIVSRADEEHRRFIKCVSVEEMSVIENNTWSSFLKQLETSGYFKELLEGSLERKILLDKAKSYYVRYLSPSVLNKKFNNSDAQRLLEIYNKIQCNNSEIQEEVCTLSPEDNDSWLNINSIQLEAMLNKKFEIIENTQKPSPSLRNKLKIFIDQSSGVEGIEFYRDKEIDLKPVVEDNNHVDFDPEVFDTALQDILDFVVPGEDEFVGSSDSELGGDSDDLSSEIDKYMQLLDSQFKEQMLDTSDGNSMYNPSTVETNLFSSIKEEAGGTGPLCSILGPIEKFKYLNLNSIAIKPKK